MKIRESLDEAESVVEEILRKILADGEPLTVIKSPPGAGKTALVGRLAATSVAHPQLALKVAAVAARREQVYDLVRRMHRDYPTLHIILLVSNSAPVPGDVRGLQNVVITDHVGGLPAGCLVVSTVSKMFFEASLMAPNSFDLLICDEAYQVPLLDFAPLLFLAEQIALVGDPGQLPPVITTDTARFENATFKVHRPVPTELLAKHPRAAVVHLPGSRRLRVDTVEFIQPSFYGDLPFVSLANEAERELRFEQKGFGNAIDAALDEMSKGSSVVQIELPPRALPTDQNDLELSDTVATLVRQALDRGAMWNGQKLSPADFGCVDAHVASGAETQRSLRRLGIATNEMMVSTPEVWQGLERPIVVVAHPLSGARVFDDFDLSPGRFCVMTSRHLLGCIVVTRKGVTEALDEHKHDCGMRPMGAADASWQGYRAHRTFQEELAKRNRVFSL